MNSSDFHTYLPAHIHLHTLNLLHLMNLYNVNPFDHIGSLTPDHPLQQTYNVNTSFPPFSSGAILI